MKPDRFESLLDGYQSGEANPDEVAELERILRGDQAKRRRFFERFLLDVQLCKVFSGVLPRSERLKMPSRGFRRVRVWLSAAAAVLVLAMGAFLLSRSSEKRADEPEVVAGQVLIHGDAVEHIPIGVRFDVGAGNPAGISLPDGSRVELAPLSQASIQGQSGESRQIVELAQGSGTFQVAHGGGRFRVETPAGTVTALGTEFSVKLRPRLKDKAGEKRKPTLAVAVIKGSVRVDAGGKSVVLSAGKKRVFGDDGEQNNRDDGQENNRDDGEKDN